MSDRDDEIALILRSLEYAPPAEGLPIAVGLLGWRLPAGDFLCARCAARIFARGGSIPRPSTPEWADQIGLVGPIIDEDTVGRCVGHTEMRNP